MTEHVDVLIVGAAPPDSPSAWTSPGAGWTR